MSTEFKEYPRKPLRLTDKLALTSYDVVVTDTPRFEGDDLCEQVNGLLPMLRDWALGEIDHAAYDLSITVKILGDDHPRLRPICGALSAALKRVNFE